MYTYLEASIFVNLCSARKFQSENFHLKFPRGQICTIFSFFANTSKIKLRENYRLYSSRVRVISKESEKNIKKMKYTCLLANFALQITNPLRST